MKSALVLGAGGFIGSHLVKRLKRENFQVSGVDLKYPEFGPSAADEFIIGDLRNQQFSASVLNKPFDDVYQLAADMGGAGYLFTGNSDADIMSNSALINLNVLRLCAEHGAGRIFYSSSACVYPTYNQSDPGNPKCSEDSVLPAEPDSEYGWEKLFSERLYLNFGRNYKLKVRIARLHGIYGPEGTWTGGKEKAPAAICRKVAEAPNGGCIEIWGDGVQTRSFLYVDECIEGIRRIMESDCEIPLNLGSSEIISIDGLARMIMDISGKNLKIKHIPGPTGVRGRNSDNTLIKAKLNWSPGFSLPEGMKLTYNWIESQVRKPALNA